MLNAKSHYPAEHVKRAVINNTIKTYSLTPPYASIAPYFKKLLNRLGHKPKGTVVTHSTSTESDLNQRKPPSVTVNSYTPYSYSYSELLQTLVI